MYSIYILASDNNFSIYIGVTHDLKRRIYEHKTGKFSGFTKEYHIHKLVYYEQYNDVTKAISREKQLKRWVRAKKNALINKMNPLWKDLSEGWYPDG